MSLVIKLIYKSYFTLVEDKRDKRMENFFLMGSPLKVISVLTLYWFFVKKIGPKMMENRKPFDLRNVLLIYNILQVLINLWLALYITYLLFVVKPYPDFGCMMPFKGYDYNARREMQLVYVYCILKVMDLLDTVFFILRKRFRQVTYLHVYHHILICFGSFMVANYLPGGHNSILGLLNSYVHVFMYLYYFLSVLRSDIKNSIHLKKRLTQLQLVQFCLLLAHYMRPLLFRKDCKFPKLILVLEMIQVIFMIVLFADFYIKAYLSKSKVKSISTTSRVLKN